ncbi:MAG TPA: hypothetical protein VMV68_06680 [Spirochaetia bacterium]|nr:hypothetical protein [Spirochaetia bacterium]
MIRRFLVILVLLVAGLTELTFAQSSGGANAPTAPPSGGSDSGKNAGAQVYALGDQAFLLNAGLAIPLFFQQETGAVAGTNLSLGGVGSLGWDAYLNEHLSLGIDLGGMFALSPNQNVLFMVPITGTVTWTFRHYPFEFPIFLGAGVNFTVLTDQLYFGPILKPGAGAYMYISSKWELGLRATYWWVPEIYFGGTTPASRSRFGNFLGISFSAIFHP